MLSVQINVRGAAEILNAIPQVGNYAAEDFIQRAVVFVHRAAKRYAPVDTGYLRGHINYLMSLRGIASSAEVGTEVEYAPHVEFGTKPHFPPVQALEGWVRRHKLGAAIAGRKTSNAKLDQRAAFLVARAISKHGTKAHPFMQPAVDDLEADMGKRLVESFNRAKARYNFR